MRTLRAGMPSAIMALAIVPVGKVYAQDWPDIFNPLELVALNLEMDPGDWNTIQHDEKFDIEVPAMFWMDGEKPILVAVRRKSSDPLGGGPFLKVSLKIDINELVPGQLWHGLRKISLENGDDQDVASEGICWEVHRLATGSEGYGYDSARASWITLVINDVHTGIYLSVEQRDKRFLQNRGLYIGGQTWLYKMDGGGQFELKVGGPEDSPTVEALCYAPFRTNPDCETPGEEELPGELAKLINMQGMLSLGAADAFISNSDALFTHRKNCFFADFLNGTRMYFPWDLDSALGNASPDIYGDDTTYEIILLGNPTIRAQYSQIMNDLICGPLSASSLVAFVDAIEPVLTEALENDANNQIEGSIADHFDSLRNYLSNRVANVTAQIEDFEPCDVLPCPWDIDGNNDVGVKDLLFLLGAWGPCPKKGDCPADFDNTGDVNVPDLLDLLGNWGPCP